MEYNPDIYIPKLRYKPDVVKIDDNNFITISGISQQIFSFYFFISNITALKDKESL